MSELNKVKLTDNAEYDLKDDTGTISSHLHHDEDLVPLVSKTYTNVIGTSNNFAGAWFFYGKVLPTDFYDIYKIHYRITSVAAGRSDAKTICDVWICGTQSALLAYSSFNVIANTGYYAQHNNEFYRATAAGITNQYGHLIGVRLQSSWNPTTAANSRTITVDIIETINCTFTFFDSMTKYADVPGTGATNYSAYSDLNGTSQGLQETGDADNVDSIICYFNMKTGVQGIWQNSLCMEDGTGAYQNICTASDGTATGSNRTTANTKLANTNGFRVGSSIYYVATNYNANTNINGWGAIRTMQGNLFDARWSFNVTLTDNSLTPFAPIYLVGTINSSDGLFHLDQTWWTQTPTATDKIYVLVGGCYDSTTSNCRISLLEHNKWYRYDGTKLVELTNGHIVNKDVPSNAVFTDTQVTQTKTVGNNAYNILLAGTTSEETETTTVRKSPSLKVEADGDLLTFCKIHTNTQQNSILEIGNNLGADTEGSTRGYIRLYSFDGKKQNIVPSEGNSADRSYYLPVVSGNKTLAYQGENVSDFNNDAGYVTTDNKVTITHSTSNNSYPVCFEAHNNTTEYTTKIFKTTKLTVNASTGRLGLGNASYTESGITLASNGGIWNDTQLLRLMASNESNYYVDLGIKETDNPAWAFCPAVTKKLRLGSPSKLWTTIYAQTGSINTSDRKEKKDIVSLDERAKNFIMALNPVSYKFIDGDSGRTHYGMIAQDVEEEMTELGMTAMDFAGFCKDQKNTDYKDSEGRTKQMSIPNEYRYGLRYEEFIAPMIKTIQMQQQEIDELKSELAEIKALLLNK